MLRKLLMHWVVLAVVLALVALFAPDVEVSGGLVGLLLAAAVIGLVNAIVGPVLRLLSAPITLVTLGLFSLVLNGLMLIFSAWLSDSLTVGGPIRTILAALVISALNTLMSKLVID